MELALPLWVLLAVGGLALLIAIAGRGTLAEGIIMSAILALVAWIALAQPLPVWGRQLVLSAVVGMISGLIAVGVYSDFFANRAREHDAPPPPPDPAPQVPSHRPTSAEPPTKFAEYSTVRIARFTKAERFFEAGADEITRRPRIGDEGLVVDTGSPAEGERQYMVECLTDDGLTVWVAEFSPDELEPATGKTEK